MVPISARRRAWILAAIVVAMFTAAVEATVVATAIPTIVADLGGFGLFSWLFSAFMLAQTATTPIYGRLADVFGRKPVFLFGMGLFLVGSSLCGLSRSMEQLIAFRTLQGLGAAAIFPTTLTIVGDLYEPAERARIQGFLSSVWAVAAITGPAAGGLIVAHAGWPWVFYVNIPLGLLATAGIAAFHREPPREGRVGLDLTGAALLTAGVAAISLALAEGGIAQLGRPALLGIGGACLAAFAVWERRVRDPILSPALLARREVATTLAGSILAGMILIGLSSLVPTYVQGVLGGSPTLAGFSLSAMSIGWPLASTTAGFAMLRFGYRRVAQAGALAGTLGAVTLLALAPRLGVPGLVLATFLSGAGLGLTTTTYLIALQAAVAYRERGAATATNIFGRQLGQTLGAAAYGGLLTAGVSRRLAGAPGGEAARRGLEVLNELLAPGRAADPGTASLIREALAAGMREAFTALLLTALLVSLVTSWLPAERPRSGAGEAVSG